MKAGSIFHLPARDRIDDSLLTASNIHEGCFNHPVLILAADISTDLVTVFILTSFNGKDLVERFPEYSNQRRCRQHHVPISPSPPHPDNDIQLFLHGDLKLRKPSWVKTEAKFSINRHALINYDRHGKRYRLRNESFKVLVTYVSSMSEPTTSHLPWAVTRSQTYPPPAALPISVSRPVATNSLQARLSEIRRPSHYPPERRISFQLPPSLPVPSRSRPFKPAMRSPFNPYRSLSEPRSANIIYDNPSAQLLPYAHNLQSTRASSRAMGLLPFTFFWLIVLVILGVVIYVIYRFWTLWTSV